VRVARPPKAGARTDEEIETLLGEGRLSPAAKDRIFEGVLADVARREPRRHRLRVILASGFLAAAGGVALLLLMPRAPDGFRAKGSRGSRSAAFPVAIDCAGASMKACPVGATLLFSVSGAADGFLAAHAQPRGGGERIWYFSGDGQTPDLGTVVHEGEGTNVAPRAIRIGPEHAAGDYLVRLYVTRRPASQALLLGDPADPARRAMVVAQSEVELRVVPAASGPP
jgi:hypothetical protein